jgi:hypothetical protein
MESILHIVDVADASHPRFEALVQGPTAYSVEVLDDVLVAACLGEGLRIFAIGAPGPPRLLASLPTKGSARDIEFIGPLAVVAQGEAGVLLVDLADPQQPRSIGEFDTPGYARSVESAGTATLVADSDGLLILDLAEPSAPRLVRHLPANSVDQVVAAGTRGILMISEGIRALDLTDPFAPILGDDLEVGYEANGVDLVGSLAVVAEDFGLHLADVSNLHAIAPLGGVAGSCGWYTMAGSGTHAFVIDSSHVYAVDVGDPRAPRVVAQIPVRGDYIDVEDGAAVVARSDTLFVLDVSEPEAPFLRARWPS